MATTSWKDYVRNASIAKLDKLDRAMYRLLVAKFGMRRERRWAFAGKNADTPYGKACLEVRCAALNVYDARAEL